MDNGKIITDFNSFTNEAQESNSEVDTGILDSLIELVGSEKDVEECAKAAFKELKDSFEKNEVEIDGQEPAEKLAMASLIVKLVETGKLGPQEADSFIADNMSGSEEDEEELDVDKGEEGGEDTEEETDEESKES